MQEIKCIIADDEPLARKLITSYVEQTPFLKLKGVFKNSWEVKDFLYSNPVDLILLDIEMPGLDGLTFFKTLNNPPKVIFITAHRDYAVDAFEVNASDYLMKPVAFERFLKALNHVHQIKNTASEQVMALATNDHLFISIDRQMQKVFFDEIEFLESMGDYVKFYIGLSKPLITKARLKDFVEKLPSNSFLQIHRSFIINKNKINAYTQDKVKIGDKWLRISRSFKDQLDF
ncbi:DNA-binding response regulator [Marivirga lumbricoides]|uniref:DNA-binding response regulator n=2 Tax=Marivirga lumbricoides TaxID=1046115 RepID=A0ABQ1MJE3_9BACT|nr:DNA-binding response regulator [Marivirga lumbricoides]